MGFPGFLGFAPPQGYQMGEGGGGSTTITGGPTLNRLSDTNLASTSRAGTTITASSVAHTLGTYTSLIDPTATVSYGVYVRSSNVSGAVTDTSMLMNIAYEDSGGGAQTIIIPNINVGASPGGTGATGKAWFFPALIPSGKRVSAAAQAVTGSDNVLVSVHLAQDPENVPDPAPTVVTAYGADTTNSRGTSVTTGNNVFGSWTEIGTTSAAHTHWTIGYDPLGDTTIVSANVLIEIGYGPNSGAVTTFGRFFVGQSSGESCDGPQPQSVYADEVGSGTKLWCRIASGEAEARGIIIYGS